jgi:hypothetical protein
MPISYYYFWVFPVNHKQIPEVSSDYSNNLGIDRIYSRGKFWDLPGYSLIDIGSYCGHIFSQKKKNKKFFFIK